MFPSKLLKYFDLFRGRWVDWCDAAIKTTTEHLRFVQILEHLVLWWQVVAVSCVQHSNSNLQRFICVVFSVKSHGNRQQWRVSRNCVVVGVVDWYFKARWDWPAWIASLRNEILRAFRIAHHSKHLWRSRRSERPKYSKSLAFEDEVTRMATKVPLLDSALAGLVDLSSVFVDGRQSRRWICKRKTNEACINPQPLWCHAKSVWCFFFWKGRGKVEDYASRFATEKV